VLGVIDSGMTGWVPEEGVAGSLSPLLWKGTDGQIGSFGSSLPSSLISKCERHVALGPLKPACRMSRVQLSYILDCRLLRASQIRRFEVPRTSSGAIRRQQNPTYKIVISEI
jgi:hypothetical protein